MKVKEKPVGTKAQIRAMEEREGRRALTVAIALLIIIIFVSGFIIYSTFYSSSEEDALPEPTLQFRPTNFNPELKATVVDQLSLTAPNEAFVQEVASILTEANYTVDYYGGEKVTVNFYRNLPTGGYELLVLRVHSAPLFEDDKEIPIIDLFTSEPYSTSKHIPEQINHELVKAFYYEGSPEYFGITPAFIKNRMKGTFNNATIIMMGCDGLKYNSTAQAFIEKGAKAYISWSGPVSANHTDVTTVHLLQHLLIEKCTIREAVIQALVNVGGPDPTYKSILKFYPFEGKPYWIEK